MNDKPEIKPQVVSPLRHFCMTIGELPTSYLETMTYYEMLVWFTKFLQEKVIPAVDNNAEALKELQGLFIELQSYVNNYFDNLDVQDEINNKLDEMAESGQLTDIIAQYLGLAGMIAFDTVANMKEAQNLVNGSKCRTLGYYNVNDGGGAYYKIRQVTNDDVVDEMTIIKVYDNLLVAELIYDNTLNVKQLGAYGDNTHNDYNALQCAINKVKNIFIPKGTYLCNSPLTITDNVVIEGDSISNYNNSPITYIKFAGDGFTGNNLEINIKNLGLIGTNKNGSCFYNMRVNIENSSISYFERGFYYIKVSNINNCDINNNNRGIIGIVDSEITNNYIYNNEEGIYLVEGSNDNIISNNKIEWNTANGVRGVNSYHNVISNNIFDRNTESGIFLYLCHDSIIANNMLRRNCIDLTPQVNSAQILISSCDKILINSNMTATGTLQDGSGDLIPQRALQYQSSNNLTFIGNDLRGGTDTNTIVGYSNNESTILWLNNGKSLTAIIKENQIKSSNDVYINAGVTKTYTYTLDTIDQYDYVAVKYRITYMNSYNTVTNTIELYVTVLNKGSGYVVTPSTPSFNNINISGTFSDGTLTLTFVNNDTDNMHFIIEELNY